jgi:hypothetical protein
MNASAGRDALAFPIANLTLLIKPYRHANWRTLSLIVDVKLHRQYDVYYLLDGMEHPTPNQVLSARVNEFTIAIKLLLDAAHTLPALMMLYAAVDILGSLLRPESEPDTKGEYFKKWVHDYMIAHSQVAFTSEELWSARCGLLHTHTASSKLSRQGKARQLHYFRAHGASLPPAMQHAMRDALSQGKLFVEVDALCTVFRDGTQRFLAAVQSDAALEKRVLHHSTHLFGGWRYVV